MADSISFVVNAADFTAGIASRLERMPVAALTALDTAGQTGVRAAQAAAPVLTGRLAASISLAPSARPDEIVVSFGPRGDPVYLYAGKEEAATQFMEAGHKAADAALEATSAAEFGRAWA